MISSSFSHRMPMKAWHPYHHRMPVILQEDQVPAWVLDSAQSAILGQNASPALHAILPEEPLTLF